MIGTQTRGLARIAMQVLAKGRRFLRFADSLYLGVLDGTLDKRLWRGYERTIADTVAYPGFQTWWATRKHWHTDEFCALIDRHIQTAKPTIYDGYT